MAPGSHEGLEDLGMGGGRQNVSKTLRLLDTHQLQSARRVGWACEVGVIIREPSQGKTLNLTLDS